MTERTVVVLGAARSGTKILRDVLASRPDFSRVPYDVNYVWRIGNESAPDDELSPGSVDDGTLQSIRLGLDAHRNGRSVLVEKTVSNTLRVPFVNRVLPDAFYVHLIRDGRDAIESAYRQWTAPTDWGYVWRKATTFPLLRSPKYALRYAADALRRTTGATPVWGPRYRGIAGDLARYPVEQVCARQWQRCVERSLEDLTAIPRERRLEVRYEEWVKDPVSVLQRLSRALDVDPAGYDLEEVRSRVQVGFVGRSRGAVQEGALRKAVESVQPTLRRLGYL